MKVRKKPLPLSKKRKALLAFYLFCLLIGAYASCIEPFRLNVTQWKVASDKWNGQKALKIALITDTHAIWPWMTPAHIDRIVARTNARHPDLVLLLGDYVATHPFGLQLSPEQGVEPYKKLSAPCGVFAVLGNHDTRPDPDAGDIGVTSAGPWPEALIKTGIPVLRNETRLVECDNRKFRIAGLDELWHRGANINSTMTQITGDEPVIMMMHNPDSFVDVPNSVALSVAGHMHGGQIRFPFIGAVEAVLPSRYGKRFLYGHIREDGKDLVVSGGLGMTGLPLRFLMPPEITLVTLF